MSSRGGDGGWGFAVVLVLVLAVGVYVRWFAPCDALGWLPAAEIPARCLMR